MNGSRQVAALLALLALLPAAPRPAAADALDPALRARLASATPDDRIPVLVTLDEGHEPPAPVGLDRGAGRAELIAALRSRNDAAQAPVRTLLERREPGAAILPLWMVDALAVTVRPATVRELAISPGVRSVRLDAPVRLPVRTTAAAVAGPAWNLDLLRAPAGA